MILETARTIAAEEQGSAQGLLQRARAAMAAVEPYDQVIFLAGLSNDPMAEYSPSKNFIFNAAAPAYLGYIAKIAKVKRYIYACSCSVYGFGCYSCRLSEPRWNGADSR